MTSAFVIEVFGRTAGLAVREHRGFRFYASDPLFRRIDEYKFRQLRAVHSAVADLVELADIARATRTGVPRLPVPARGSALARWSVGVVPEAISGAGL